MSSRIVSNIVAGTGRRLRQLRNHFNYSLDEMARKLGLSKSGYFKNEGGFTFPGLKTLDRLQRSYDISMDWLIFNRGPMYYKQKAPVEKKPGLEEQSPEVRQLLAAMEQDPRLKHEILAYFFKYQGKPKQ